MRLYVFQGSYTDSGADTSTAADGFTLTLVPSVVPEPASLLLLAPALFGLILLRRAGLRRGAYRTPA